MNWRNGRIAVALLLLLATGCGTKYDPLDHGMTERENRQDHDFMLYLLYEQYLRYLECQKPGAISFGGGCISATTTEAIYDHATGNPLHATTAPATAQLECRDPQRTGYAAAVGNDWYRANTASPPPGDPAVWIEYQRIQMDDSGNVIAVFPLSPIVSGDHLYCLVRHEQVRTAYQAVDIL